MDHAATARSLYDLLNAGDAEGLAGLALAAVPFSAAAEQVPAAGINAELVVADTELALHDEPAKEPPR